MARNTSWACLPGGVATQPWKGTYRDLGLDDVSAAAASSLGLAGGDRSDERLLYSARPRNSWFRVGLAVAANLPLRAKWGE